MATIGNATLSKEIRAAFEKRRWEDTTLSNGVCGAIIPNVRSHMKRTLTKSRMLARYVRNSPQGKFTATDVAVVNYIQDLHDDDALKRRITSKPWYSKFLDREPRAPRAPRLRKSAAEREYNRKGKRKINNVGPSRPGRTVNRSAGPSGPRTMVNRAAGASGSAGSGGSGGAVWPATPAEPVEPAGPVGTEGGSGRRRRRSMMGYLVNMSGHYRFNILPHGDCMFNSLGVAARYVQSNGTLDGRTVSEAMQDELGLAARAEIVDFLKAHENEIVYERNNETWKDEYERQSVSNHQYLAAVRPSERSYDRYLTYLSQPGAWGDDLCLMAGQRCLLGRPVIAVQVREIAPDVFRAISHDWTDDPNLPIMESNQDDGLHYDLWLPTSRDVGPSTLFYPDPARKKVNRVNLSNSNKTKGVPSHSAGNQGGNHGGNHGNQVNQPNQPIQPNQTNQPHQTNQLNRASRGRRKRIDRVTPVQTRSQTKRAKRTRKKSTRLGNYVEKVDLRKIDIKKYKRRAIPHNNNNLFSAVKVATGDNRTIAELRAACATVITSRTFVPLAREYFTTRDEVTQHAAHVRNTGRGTEFDLYVLSHITRRTLLVRDGRTMRSFQSPSAAYRLRQEPAVLDVVLRFYDAMVKHE